MECKTYRTRAHAEGMRDTGYRTREEIEPGGSATPSSASADRLLESGTGQRRRS